MLNMSTFLNNNMDNTRYFLQGTNQPRVNIATADTSQINDEFINNNRKQGWVEKFYNFLKNKTKIGLGSDKVNAQITDFGQGQINKEDLDKTISKYRVSQENAVQTFVDTASGLAGIGVFFGVKNLAKHALARLQLNSVPDFVKEIPKFGQLVSKAEKILGSKAKVALIAAAAAAAVAMPVKNILLGINSIGSGKYKLDKAETANMSKKEIKEAKKALRKEKSGQNMKNNLTGLFNGLITPVIALGGGIAGVPLYLALTAGMRYVTNKEDKNKSLNGFASSLKDNAAVNIAGAAVVAVPAIKAARFSSILSKNMDDAVSKLKGAVLKAPELPSSKTAYDELEEILLNSPKIKNIIESGKDVDSRIKALTDENIFAVKFKQIQNDTDVLSKALKEDCPASRTIESAQTEINKFLGSDKYTVSKRLGVGTVAETYLAKDASGKEVCIKILKDGISAEKIANDKQKFIDLIKNGVPDEKLSESQKYLLKNVDNLADGIAKETNFVNEMDAAKKLQKYTKLADVVVPIEAKEGIYIMEKAPGISLETLVKYYELEGKEQFYKRYVPERLSEFQEEMEKLKAKSPDFNDFDLNNNEAKNMLYNYIDVFVEQLNKIDKNGKTLHADIHPGNIFVNLDVLKNKNKTGKKLFTLIDTGNTVDITKDQSLRALKLTSYVNNGNTKDITDYVLDGAVLPAGLTKEKAAQSIETELKKIFFDTETQLNSMSNDNLLALTNNIMRKYNVIPNDSQLNLNKAKKSAGNSLRQLQKSFFEKKFSNLEVDEGSLGSMAAANFSVMKTSSDLKNKKKLAVKLQDIKNLLHLSPKEAFKQIFNPNMHKINSPEYLTYKLKQGRNISEGDLEQWAENFVFGSI